MVGIKTHGFKTTSVSILSIALGCPFSTGSYMSIFVRIVFDPPEEPPPKSFSPESCLVDAGTQFLDLTESFQEVLDSHNTTLSGEMFCAPRRTFWR